ncbi:ABC transporter substrate-binding protein [Actinomycetospora aeridis]|uniref:ABC transporter substrate-binding protein n=1 Tax=Actinomycetospora aeridis TaxID=3129231 RepID=A0ABU8N0B3_9PSEU
MTALEVYAWATGGAEKDAVDALAGEFARTVPGRQVVNPVLAGGPDPEGDLRSRLRAGDPPDSFQVHPGAEAQNLVASGALVALDECFARWGLDDVLPAGLRDGLAVGGAVHAVPAGLHRLLLWSNDGVLARAGLTARPADVDDLVRQLEVLRASGVRYPLALGPDWTQLELLEAVLLARLGPDRFAALWTAGADWSGDDVADALAAYGRLLPYANPDRDGLSFPDAAARVRTGAAGYLFTGDWVRALWAGDRSWSWSGRPFPGTAGTFQWLGDAFVLPENAPDVDGALAWLATVAGAPGQQAFNTRKGSIPVRADADRADHSPYLRAAMADLEHLQLVPSCTHGSAAGRAVTSAALTAVGAFSSTGDVGDLRSALAATTDEPRRERV